MAEAEEARKQYGDAKGKRPGWYRRKISRKNATKSQKKALRDLYPRWGVVLGYKEKCDRDFLNRTFQREADVILDIGFGTGDALIEMAGNERNKDFLGVDWHTPGVGKCLIAIESSGLTNIRVMSKDAVEFLKQNICENRVFSGVNIFFPDPWDHQTESQKAHLRLVRPEVTQLLAHCTLPGSPLHLATDIADYVCPSISYLTSTGWTPSSSSNNGVIPRPSWRPLTQYEAKGLEAGRTVADVVFLSPEVPPPLDIDTICEDAEADEGDEEPETELTLFD
eukprot:TRINITY_DN5340_c0_g1_i1.p1 TRINITY_DN5340_c0_g1~~TRINITY_DN5340_c0_g1_i1.p1  ORF type:complete len:280 (+),score=23.75 TRINITY_DN5340_c0_g1_i1:50-889(+)